MRLLGPAERLVAEQPIDGVATLPPPYLAALPPGPTCRVTANQTIGIDS